MEKGGRETVSVSCPFSHPKTSSDPPQKCGERHKLQMGGAAISGLGGQRVTQSWGKGQPRTPPAWGGAHKACATGEQTRLEGSGCGVCGGRGPAAESPGRSADQGVTDSKWRSHMKVEAEQWKT